MNSLYKLAWVAGLTGVLLCVFSAGGRLAGAYWVGSFQSGTLLLAGIAAMVFGCFCFLAVLTKKT